MKKYISIMAVACCLFLSCERVSLVEVEEGTPSPFTGQVEQMGADSKTYLDEYNNILWGAGDEVLVFAGTTLGKRYGVSASSVGRASVDFDYKESINTGFSGGTTLTSNVAYYPFDANIECKKGDQLEVTNRYTLDVNIPYNQTYVQNNFGPGANPMVAVTESVSDTDLLFRNICGGIRLKIKGSGKISKIILQGNNGELLSGNARVHAFVEDNMPSIEFVDNANTAITLIAPENAVSLDPQKSKSFYISVPPTNFSKGFKVIIIGNNGGSKEYTTSTACEVKRSVIMEMPELEFAASVIVADGGDLSFRGTANSYIVPTPGNYKFKLVKGNSTTSVGEAVFAQVLWETFGTDTAPAVGDLIKSVSILNDYVIFETNPVYKKGNALIAVKDITGKILWSWHIWMTDYPLEQEYYNNAGFMMDRNLGATSATPGDVGALGLLYQWGRKDPFLGGSAISYSSWANQAKAASTLTWPDAVTSDVAIGTIAYAQEHPTTFIKHNSSNYDWYYTGSSSTDNTRWQSSKTIYDPGPPGYRVPDGGSYGVWSRALGSSNEFYDPTLYNYTTKGFNFYGKFGDTSTIWYPLSGYLNYSSGQLYDVGSGGYYWSISPSSNGAYHLSLSYNGSGSPSYDNRRADGQSVRCLQE